jgi:hypothetical protein
VGVLYLGRFPVKRIFLAAGLAATVLLVGCGGRTIPPKLQVRDVSSGRSYTTYEPWGQVEKGVGYEFTDIETGKRITLTNYELSTVEGKKSVPGDSPEAKAFAEAKERGGVK